MSIYISSRALPYVYKLTHKETGQFYFGYRKKNVDLNLTSSQDLGQHYFTSSKTIMQLGFQNFDCEIIAEFYDADDAFYFEQSLIRANFTNPLILNKNYSDGNDFNWYVGKQMPQAIKEAISKAHKGKKFSCSHRENIGNSKRGIVTSEETKKKISDAFKNRSAEDKLKTSELISSRSRGIPKTNGDKLREYHQNKSEQQRKNFSQAISERMRGVTNGAKSWTLSFEDSLKEIKIENLTKWCRENHIPKSSLMSTRFSGKFYNGMRVTKDTY